MKSFMVYFANGSTIEVSAREIHQVHGAYRLVGEGNNIVAVFTDQQIIGIVDTSVLTPDAPVRH